MHLSCSRGGEGHIGEGGGAKYKNVPFWVHSRVQREGRGQEGLNMKDGGQEGVKHEKYGLEGVFCMLNMKVGVWACEGWGEHALPGRVLLFDMRGGSRGVFGSREGVRETMNMQNTPLWACFACLGCGVGRKTIEHKKHTHLGMFFVFFVVAAVLSSALDLCSMPRVVGAMGCWRHLVVS